MDSRTDAAWALLRVTFGSLLAWLHGKPKVFDPGKIDSFSQSVANLGFPFPMFFAWCAALSEFAGGLLIAVGLLTRPAAAFAGFTMLVAAYRHRTEGLGKLELALIFLALCIFTFVRGGGRFSVDALLRGRLGRWL